MNDTTTATTLLLIIIITTTIIMTIIEIKNTSNYKDSSKKMARKMH